MDIKCTVDGLMIRCRIDDDELAERIARIPESDYPMFLAHFEEELRKRLMAMIEPEDNK